MNEDIRREWADRLRSGRYTQGRGRLKTQMSGQLRYCCLGVLADMAEDQGVLDSVYERGQWKYRPAGTNEVAWRESYLPEIAVKDWCGLTFDQQDKLATLNDGGCDFHGIADWIEREL